MHTSLLLSFFSEKRVGFPGGMKWFKQSCCRSSAVLLCVCQELNWLKGTDWGEVKDVAVHRWVRCSAGYPCWLPAQGIDSTGSPRVCLCQLLCDLCFFSDGLCAPFFLDERIQGFAYIHTSWEGAQLAIHDPLPDPDKHRASPLSSAAMQT